MLHEAPDIDSLVLRTEVTAAADDTDRTSQEKRLEESKSQGVRTVGVNKSQTVVSRSYNS